MKIESEIFYVLLPILLVFVGFFGFVLLTFFKNKKYFAKTSTVSFSLQILAFMTIVLLAIGLIYVIVYLLIFHLGWLMLYISVFIIIGILAILFKSLNLPKLKLPNTKSFKLLELIKLIIFYLPCLLIDIVDYIKFQYNITTKTVWILLLLEIILIVLRILIPYLYKEYSNRHSHLILKDPIYLDKETDLGYFQNSAFLDPSIDRSEDINFNYNYAISTWVRVNPQPRSTSSAYNKSSSLINFGNIIKIMFNKNNLEILAATNKTNEPTNKLITIYKGKKLLYQTWNNIIINYSGGTLDIFINNSLVVSKQNITPLTEHNKVIAGTLNGIHGSIKDIIYYDKILSRSQIHAIYNSYL